MELLVSISLIAGTVLLGLKLSLFERRRVAIIVACIAALQPVALLPWYVNLPWISVREWLGGAAVIEALSAVLGAEAMLSMVLSIVVLRKHYAGRKVASRWSLALYPPVAFLIPLNLGHIALLNSATSLSFATTAGLAALATALLLVFAGVPARLLFHWSTRMEMLLAGLVFQLVVSAALPVLLGTAPAPASSYPVSVPALGAFLLVCASGLAGGYAWKRFGK